jgi:hypothetical protein
MKLSLKLINNYRYARVKRSGSGMSNGNRWMRFASSTIQPPALPPKTIKFRGTVA